ncbi:hypothetical protein K469DRAFT_96306 [Zopfia rhizophila CBS 207.26]|uniref:Uncharacterized protein n=1 Tax=Zopfia rhizophila CBS 207.26 TaxID=1314779 RepID=A0A6A6D8S9_9PEZI|nr:hypothetical protein K469DRAFT_96306 [Zopfia rhizophila CBS 207.26]
MIFLSGRRTFRSTEAFRMWKRNRLLFQHQSRCHLITDHNSNTHRIFYLRAPITMSLRRGNFPRGRLERLFRGGHLTGNSTVAGIFSHLYDAITSLPRQLPSHL